MDLAALLTAIALLVPLAAVVTLWATNGVIAERHHVHHDTYVIARTLSWSLVFGMILMGVLGVLLEWLCSIGAFHADGVVVLGFFDAYLVISFVYWLLLRRYKVVTYDDRMTVTPFFGKTVGIAYADISAMEWTQSIVMPRNHNVRVYEGQQRRVLLSGALDIDQILVRINRFDALENPR